MCWYRELHVRSCRYGWGDCGVVWVVRCVAEDGNPFAEDFPWQSGFDPFHELSVCDHYRGW